MTVLLKHDLFLLYIFAPLHLRVLTAKPPWVADHVAKKSISLSFPDNEIAMRQNVAPQEKRRTKAAFFQNVRLEKNLLNQQQTQG
ncbi:MAG: hypothetical protein KF888_11050 [Nitrosomonas sp.]|nr:hypothetical protein [Nitrosomonas sp.]